MTKVEPNPDDPWRASWESINALAWWSLNRSAALNPRRDGVARLRLWDDAKAFGCRYPPMTLTVFEEPYSRHRSDPIVRKATWERMRDLDLLSEAVRKTQQEARIKPTIDVQDAVVPSSRFADLLDEAGSLHVPVVWPHEPRSLTLDVSSVGFEFFSYDHPPAVLRLEWSLAIPTQWEPVVAWATRLRGFLKGYLRTKGDRAPGMQGDRSHPLWDREIDAGTA